MKVHTALLALAAVSLLSAEYLRADGTEGLGTPSIPIQSGTGIVAGGTGMLVQPGVIALDVPPASLIKQVVLYWQGFAADAAGGDATVALANGGSAVTVTGVLIGGPTLFFDGAWASTYRADITALGLVAPGLNSLSVSDMAFGAANNGAGILVLFDDGSSNAHLAIRDGSDAAFIGFTPPLDTTVPQTFAFPASAKDRTANLDLFFGSVSGTASGLGFRPTSIELITNGPKGGTTVLSDLLDSNTGDEFDAFTIAVDLPAGATVLTVQALSRDDRGTGNLPASFVWLAAGFALEPETPPTVPGRMTGGGSVFTIGDVRVTRGFEIHCDLRDPNTLEVNWAGHKFHLTELTAAVCIDQVSIAQAPPVAPFDTFKGTGVGKLNNQAGARIEFVFVDAGEPGTSDTATLKIYDPNGTLVLDVPGDPQVPGSLTYGNLQAHKDNPPKGQAE
jgi:hypothetical protein